MAVVTSGNVTQSVPANGVVVLTFTDTSTGVGTLISRTLNIYNSLGIIVDTVNMGAMLTATYSISADGYYSFVETIIDNTGTYVLTVNYVATAFYQYAFSQAVAALTSLCGVIYGQVYNLSYAEINKNSAIDMALFGQGVNAQSLITYANFLIATPYYA